MMRASHCLVFAFSSGMLLCACSTGCSAAGNSLSPDARGSDGGSGGDSHSDAARDTTSQEDVGIASADLGVTDTLPDSGPSDSGTILQANYYVAPDGNDNGPGTITQPFATISRAIQAVSAGELVYVRAGIYKEVVTIDKSGTNSAPIKVFAYPGEVPVISGENYTSPPYGGLFDIGGDYVVASGFETRYSKYYGAHIYGNHSTVSKFNAHHSQANGIVIADGDHNIVEDSSVWQSALDNEGGTKPAWAGGLTAARTTGSILRRNKVYQTWGEGLSTFTADGTIIEDNIVYDNWQTNVYISDSINVLFQRNLVYNTSTGISAGMNGSGIMMGDEEYNPPISDITIINNLVVGTDVNFDWWQGEQGGGMTNVLIAYNTFVNSNYSCGIYIAGGPHENVRFESNIIEQDDSLPIAGVESNSGLQFSNNLWSKTPSSTVSSPTDVVGNPKLVKTDITPGALTVEYFKLQATSPAINKAKLISEVAEDFTGYARGNSPDIGGYEYH
jgi:hypothetical protein